MILETIRPIRIPQRGEILTVGTELTVSGWGVTESSSTIVDNLLYTSVASISNLQCATVFGTSVILSSTVCTLGSPLNGPCSVSTKLMLVFASFKVIFLQGDSGGPLVSYQGLEPTLVGVASFIHRDGCTSGYPSGYVRIESQLSFINDVINATEHKGPQDPEPEPEPLPVIRA